MPHSADLFNRGEKMANFTRNAIKDTFIKMLNERPLSQISVKDITSELDINRNTFYYHFHDIPQLIEEIIIEESDIIIKKYNNIDTIETAFDAVIDFAEKNKKAILHIYNSVNRDIFETYLWKVCEYVVITYGTETIGNKNISEFDRKTLITLYKCELFGVAMSWMNNPSDENLRGFVSRICEICKGMIEESVNRCEQ